MAPHMSPCYYSFYKLDREYRHVTSSGFDVPVTVLTAIRY